MSARGLILDLRRCSLDAIESSFRAHRVEVIRRVVRENPWATLVSGASGGLVASHYPVLLDESRDELSLLTHVRRPDEEVHKLGEHELLIIVQGPHGYISSSWYGDKPAVPTWNFIGAHLSGVPEILDPAENLKVLSHLVDVFEEEMSEPRRLHRTEPEWKFAAGPSQSTVGLRLTPSRITAKQKMSQNRRRRSWPRSSQSSTGTAPTPTMDWLAKCD
ncbi:MAG: FMN-binding negative transcriptional regulator [Solirubrobacteraceae bacterium]